MSNSTDALKQEIRRQARTAAGSLKDAAPHLSGQIRASLAAWPLWSSARTLLAFLPLPPPAIEPDLVPLLIAAIAEGRRVCLPRVDWNAGRMTPAIVEDPGSLPAGRFGVREPSPQASAVPLAEIDLILVPGLAFDMEGNRLGRGAGFYDRFLATREGAAPPACGVCFEAQLVDRIPTEPWDVPMNAVVTERRLVTLPA